LVLILFQNSNVGRFTEFLKKLEKINFQMTLFLKFSGHPNFTTINFILNILRFTFKNGIKFHIVSKRGKFPVTPVMGDGYLCVFAVFAVCYLLSTKKIRAIIFIVKRNFVATRVMIKKIAEFPWLFIKNRTEKKIIDGD
jgi:hypothetical protein